MQRDCCCHQTASLKSRFIRNLGWIDIKPNLLGDRQKKPGCLLAYSLKQLNNMNHIAGIRWIDGAISTSSKQINVLNHFTRLFTHDKVSKTSKGSMFFLLVLISHSSDSDRDFLDAPLRIEAISQAISNRPLNKSPGTDSLPTDYYRTFEDIICPLLVDVYKDAFKAGSLPLSTHTEVISLTHKIGKDVLDPRRYQPISFLNCDQENPRKSSRSCCQRLLAA